MYNLTDDTEIDVSIGVNFFAPKCADRDLNFDTRNSHAMANSACNFLCSFCKHGLKEVKPHLKSFGDYKKRVAELMEQGKMFKFTGGEPCMNPYLPEMIRTVKENGRNSIFRYKWLNVKNHKRVTR